MQIMHPGPCISCITQNTSHPQLSQYLRSAIHKPQKYLFTTSWLFSWNSYILNQTGISEIFRAHSLRRLLVVPRLVWGESVSVRGKRERRESETLVFKTGWMWKFECVCGHRQAVPGWVAQPRSPQHTHVTSQSALAAILGADLTFTLSTFTSQRMPSDHHLLDT